MRKIRANIVVKTLLYSVPSTLLEIISNVYKIMLDLFCENDLSDYHDVK